MNSTPWFTRFAVSLFFGFVALATGFAQTAPPSIYYQPSPVVANAGQAATFYGFVSGNPSPSLQWQRQPAGSGTWANVTNSGAYSGATTAFLNISLVTLAMNGDQFRLIATNSEGSDTSSIVLLTVNPAVAPQVYGMSSAVTVNSGDALNLNPGISGTQPMTYQWKKDGTDVSGATGSSYYKYNVTTADSGSYVLAVTNYAGSVTSSAVTVTVNPPVSPGIFNLPASLTIDAGTSLSLSPTVTGTQPITYQWKKDGVAISGATSSSYYKSSSSAAADNGTYTLVATNSAGSTTSSAITVTVNPAVAPAIFNLPATLTLNYGDYLGLNPSITGTQPITYQWKKDGVAISGAVSSTYGLYSITTANNGLYTLTATNAVGTVTSSAVAVTVNAAVAPVISNLPASLTLDYGGYINLNASVTGSPSITYQWKKDGVAISGATSTSYGKYSGTTPADNGQYTLSATNSVATVTSAPVTVTVNAAVAPTIYGLPSSLTVDYGTSISISPTILGTSPLTCQWKKAGVAISGATSTSYGKYSGVTTADSGEYTITVTNAAGTVTSSAVTVTVNAAVAPVVFNLPATLTVDYGTSLSINPTISGSQPMTYQWKKGGVAISGATSSSYGKYSGVTTADSGQYTVTATNAAGTVTSSAVTVTVNAAVAPVIFNLPATLSFDYGANLTINPTITGSQPMTYQWRKGGVAISGATSSSYGKYGGVTTADSGQYTVTATNAAGTVTSSAVTVTVNAAVAPTIFNLPVTTIVPYGSSFTFYPTITGSQPMTYQWKKDGVAISGATSGSYSKYSSVTTADSGQYTLTVTNPAGTVTSSVATLTVQAAVAPAISGLPSAVTVAYGAILSINPLVTGTQPITYQWKKDGVAIFGASNASYSGSVTTADAGSYTLEATNLAGTVTSSTVTVTVSAAIAPAIFNLPAPLNVSYGASIYIGPSIAGTQPMTYQWKKDGVAIAGATSATYSKSSNVTNADTGSYTLTATNSVGSTTSSAVTVTVDPAVAPAIYGLPAAATVDYGIVLTINPTISGTLPITYQWKKGGVAIAGATSSSYLSNGGATTADAGVYTLTATNLMGSVTSASVTVTVNPAVAPGIFNLPASVTLNYGDTLYFYPTTAGTQPVTYLWKKDGVAIDNSNYQSYSDYYVTTADGGNYTLEATNVAGTTVSSAVAVTVRAAIAPVLTDQPRSLAVTFGQTANFSVVATGTSPITYQWSLDGQPILGATGSTLIIPNVQVGDVGSYTVTATNPGGSITSSAASLSMNTLGVVTASSANDYSVFIKSDGTLWGMGNNNYGQLGDGSATARLNPVQVATGVVSVSAGGQHTLFVKSDGSLWGMGLNSVGQLGDGTYSNRFSPVQIATGVVSASAGSTHSLFIKSDGSLWAMGSNGYGELGDGTSVTRRSPVMVVGGVTSAAAGGGSSLFIKSDGSLWAMGYNSYGQLGDGTTVNRTIPVQISTGVTAVAALGGHSMFLKLDGTLWAMGGNYYGQLGDGTTTVRTSPVQIATNVSAIARGSGASHSHFIKSDDTLWGMGSNNNGQLGDATTTSQSSPVQIATGVSSSSVAIYHSLYVTTAGTLWYSGYNIYGQFGVGYINYSVQNTPAQTLSGTLSVPSAPVASISGDGDLTTGVRLTWSQTLAATRYEVWRNTSNNSASATLIASNVPIALYYDLTATSGSTYYYWIKAVNSTGTSGFSASDIGFVGIPPAITTQPSNQTANEGTSVSFSATYSGTPSLTYQWQKNGVNIAGATSSSYTIASLTGGDAASYRVVVSNPVGSATSNAAVLTVVVAPSSAVISFTIE